MVRLTDVIEHGPAVRDVIHCAICDNPMELVGSDYRCTSNVATGTAQCTAAPVNANDLVRIVMTQLANRIVTPRTTEQLNDLLIQKVKEELDQIEKQVKEMIPTGKGAEPGKLFEEYQNSHNGTVEIGQQLEGIKQVIDKLEEGQQHLSKTARDAATYLGYTHPQDNRAMVNAFIIKLQVRTGEAHVTYALPLADEHHQATITQELLVL